MTRKEFRIKEIYAKERVSDFVTSASCVPDEFPKTQNKLWNAFRRTQRSIDRSEDVFVEYPVCVISVAVVKRRLFLFVFDVIYNRRSIFVLQ